MNHGGQSAAGSQLATDPSHASTVHSPTMQLMSQPPANHPVQSDPNAGPYVAVHRFGVAPGPEGYAHHVLPPFVPGPPPLGGELMYTGESSGSQEPAGGRGAESMRAEEEEGSPVASGSIAELYGKRKQPDSGTSESGGARKRHHARAPADGLANGGEGDAEVGPNGGPKHWTEDEKTRFFTWMLTSDDHWEAFRTRMNTVFRECSNEVFPGKKSYTALKSCYHRNLEVFKQIHAFQMFSANHLRQLQAENPNAQQPSIDSVLEAAKVAGLNVGTLSVKTIDRWYETGWFELFRKRYREDPKTGLPVPYYGSSDLTEEGPSSGPTVHAMMGIHAHPNIDPQILAQNAPSQGAERGTNTSPGPSQSSTTHMSSDTFTFLPSSLSQPSEYRPSTTSPTPTPFTYLRSSQAGMPRGQLSQSASAQSPARPTAVAASRTQSDISVTRDPPPADSPAHMAQAYTQLTTVTESLMGVCASLKEFVRQQNEESKLRMEIMRAEAAQRQRDAAQSREGAKDISLEKVTFATEILKNGPDNEDIKRAAIECLTRYLMRGL
ncbi:hypothetical protein C2E23DRAFT_443059 [Lenzites betulinus]|nr:hypothetical protein C2E23DRAFT_443059 [Lenzites betulinus]